MDGTGYETATKAALAADGERHHWLQSVPCMRRAQPISCKCATSARNRPEIAVIQRPRGLHAAILVTSHTHTHTHTLSGHHDPSTLCSESSTLGAKVVLDCSTTVVLLQKVLLEYLYSRKPRRNDFVIHGKHRLIC